MKITTDTQEVLAHIIVKTIPMLNEKQKREFLGTVALELGHGGIAFVNSVTGVARNTIVSGAEEVKETTCIGKEAANPKKSTDRIRKEGAGRKALTEKIPDLHEKIQQLIGAETYGNPERPIFWTTWSVRKIADKLKAEPFFA